MSNPTKTPAVRIARPKGRPFQLRYVDSNTGRKIRISTGSRDEAKAERMRCKAEAKLTLGMPAEPKKRTAAGPYMAWEDFRKRYSELQLSTLRESSAYDSEVRLDVAERIVKPRTLTDMVDRDMLHELQSRLLAGAEGNRNRKTKENRPRRPHTVRT